MYVSIQKPNHMHNGDSFAKDFFRAVKDEDFSIDIGSVQGIDSVKEVILTEDGNLTIGIEGEIASTVSPRVWQSLDVLILFHGKDCDWLVPAEAVEVSITTDPEVGTYGEFYFAEVDRVKMRKVN